MTQRIGLITILTDNIPEMRKFYQDILGFEIKEDLGDYVEFITEGVRFAIYQREGMIRVTGNLSYHTKPTGHSFELAFPKRSHEDVEDYYRLVVKRGAKPIRPPEMMPWRRVTAFIADPDDNIHEIYSLNEGEEI